MATIPPKRGFSVATPLLRAGSVSFQVFRASQYQLDYNFFTGFPDYKTLLVCYNFLNPGENIVYVDSATEDLEFAAFSDVDGSQGNKPGRRRKISTPDEFFMILVRLRLGLFELDLAHRFRVHVSNVNRICISWINFLYLKFGYLNNWPDRETIDKAMPQSFKDKYPKNKGHY